MSTIAVDEKANCPECGVGIATSGHALTGGVYTHSVFHCDVCNLNFPTMAGYFVAEPLTENTVVFPDRLVKR